MNHETISELRRQNAETGLLTVNDINELIDKTKVSINIKGSRLESRPIVHLSESLYKQYINDLKQDIEGILLRLDYLRERVLNIFTTETTKEEKKRLEGILDTIEEIQDKMIITIKQKDFFNKTDMTSLSEKILKIIFAKYRELLKIIANEEELDSRLSPAYAASKKRQSGKGQEPRTFLYNYQRESDSVLKRLETIFGSNYFGQINSIEKPEHFLCQSGLSAIDIVTNYLADELTRTNTTQKDESKRSIVLKTENMYFETDNKVRKKFAGASEVCELDPENTENIIKRIKEETPFAVFLSPISNSYDLKVTEIKKILLSLCDEKWVNSILYHMDPYKKDRVIHIVIDNTMAGRLAKWKEIDFSKLPPFIKIISLESLGKYVEDGQDLVQAGLVTTLDRKLGKKLREERRANGTRPTENTYRKISNMDKTDLIDKKMERHSRNGALLAELLRETHKDDDFIERVNYPNSTQEIAGGGGVLSLGFNWSKFKTFFERSSVMQNMFIQETQSIANAFNILILKTAKKVGLDVNLGTSFGFDITRIATYERKLRPEKEPVMDYRNLPYARIAIGTENTKDIYLLYSVIKSVNEIFSQALNLNMLYKLATKIITENKEEEN